MFLTKIITASLRTGNDGLEKRINEFLQQEQKAIKNVVSVTFATDSDAYESNIAIICYQVDDDLQRYTAPRNPDGKREPLVDINKLFR